MQADDDMLVKQSRDGDLDAFEELVKRYEGKVYTVAYRFMGNHADASDLAQEAFIKAFQALTSFRGDSSFATWLYRITANACRDEIRKQHRQKKLSLEEMISHGGGSYPVAGTEPSPEESLERWELHDLVQKQLNGLSGDHRLILVMRELQGMSYEEIAASLDCTLGTVKSRLNRARQALKQRVLAHRELFDINDRLASKSKEG